jgi:hypothetical protein
MADLLLEAIFLHHGQLGKALPVPRLREMFNRERNADLSVSTQSRKYVTCLKEL